MRQISTLGIDTAKQVLQLHGVDAQGNATVSAKDDGGRVMQTANLGKLRVRKK